MLASCTKCPIVFGTKTIKTSDLDLRKFDFDSPAWSSIETTRAMTYEYMRLAGEDADLTSATGYKGVQRLILWQMSNPAGAHALGSAPRHQRTARHAAFGPACI